MLKMEEKKTESERNENESRHNKKWIESLGFEKFTGWRTKKARRTDEERWRMVKNLNGFGHENVSEALRKHLGLDFLHGNTFFHLK